MLHERIKALRTALGMTQVDLAAALGVSKQCVSNWENDNIQPSVEMLARIARFFRVSCDYLLGLDNAALRADGLSEAQLAHIRLLIDDLAAANAAARGTKQKT